MKENLSVSELTGYIKQTLENEFSEVNVIGEISNFKPHVSGHWYFTLKDSGAQISCTMWKGVNSYVFFTPQDGMKIIVSGKISVYPPRGNYQIDVRSMKPAGVGELQAAFEKLKQKLSTEGLFNSEFKKAIPKLPSKIGIVTAIDGAAFQDMISIASRRFPLVEFVIASAKVQGDGSAEDIANSIRLLNKFSDVDLIIVGRGGGSLEDLWAFNEEVVARAIFNSKIPIISAVGHEIDFTIADFVADLRAPTPSAAIELSTPDSEDLLSALENYSSEYSDILERKIDEYYNNLDLLVNSYGFRQPLDIIKNKTQQLDAEIISLNSNIDKLSNQKKYSLEILNNRLAAMNIDNVLKRGFIFVKQNGKVINRADKFNYSNSFTMKFYDGDIKIDGQEKGK